MEETSVEPNVLTGVRAKSKSNNLGFVLAVWPSAGNRGADPDFGARDPVAEGVMLSAAGRCGVSCGLSNGQLRRARVAANSDLGPGSPIAFDRPAGAEVGNADRRALQAVAASQQRPRTREGSKHLFARGFEPALATQPLVRTPLSTQNPVRALAPQQCPSTRPARCRAQPGRPVRAVCGGRRGALPSAFVRRSRACAAAPPTTRSGRGRGAGPRARCCPCGGGRRTASGRGRGGLSL
jgi:hypothetical protein